MKKPANTDDIKPVEFSNGVRGKHQAACTKGYTVKMQSEDGTTSIRKFVPEKNAIVLDADIRTYFPDAKAVNSALRGLIDLLPKGKKRAHTA